MSISPRPVSGPENMSLMSWQSLYRSMLADLIRPLSDDMSVRRRVGLNLFFALVKPRPESLATSLATMPPNLGSAFSPVPTAVPPMGSSSMNCIAFSISFESRANSSA